MIGHILGLSHDGDKGAGNRCKEEAEYGSVMAPMVGATFRKIVNKAIVFFFTTCNPRSKTQIFLYIFNQKLLVK